MTTGGKQNLIKAKGEGMSYTPDHQEPEVGLINAPYFFPFFLSEDSSWFSENLLEKGNDFFSKKKKEINFTRRHD